MTPPTRFVIITGASGSGKTTALKTMEDLGFYAIDNLPPGLLPAFVQLVETGHSDISRAAMVMDVRVRESLDRCGEVIRALRDSGRQVSVLFLSASPDVLLRRYSETRRVHPLDPSLPLGEAIARELTLLRPLREAADLFLDTTDIGPHELRRTLRERFASGDAGGRMLLTFLSFGYKFGLPKEADLVFDVRFLPNPFFSPELRARDGRDPEVAAFVDGTEEARRLLGRLEGFLEDLLPSYLAEGRGYLTVAVGCTGGQHRSVAIVEMLAGRFRGGERYAVQVRHRELTEG